MSDRYEAHKLHYLTRAAEVLGISDPKAEAKYALGHQRNWQTLHPVARYIAGHEPPPDTEFMRFLHKRRDASYMASVREKWRRVREGGK